MDICFQVVLFQTEKKASIKFIIIYFCFIRHVYLNSISFYFKLSFCFIFLHLFADNVGV